MEVNLPARKLPERPDLDHLKRQAKDLLDAFAAGETSTMTEVREYYRDADPKRFALHDAQLVLARAYGFTSWPKLKARVDGVTAARLHDAVEQGELEAVRDLLRRRPEIVNRERPGHGERLALHIAVLRRDAAMTRLLMEHGADAHSGIWPYRKETQALTIAAERGYDDIVAVIQEKETQREKAQRGPATLPPEIDPAASAVVLGDVSWIRARHTEGTLMDPASGDGLLTLAVKNDRPEILTLLLEFGFDPDERRREPGADEIVYSWGQPLQECTKSGNVAMAEMLLSRGADANAWACVWNAYRQRDSAMIELLARYGGVPNAATPGYLRDTELAARMFADEAAGKLPKGTVREGKTVAEEVIDPAASAGATDILRMALELIDWQRDDPRWFSILASPLCFWNHIPWIYSEKWDLDRSTYLPCFALVLERCHADVSGRFGMTILHYAAASYNWVKSEERVAFVSMLLNHGARMDVRDDLLKSTPLGWACRWGRTELVKLLLERGADPVEADAEPWATPRAWAQKMGPGHRRRLAGAYAKISDDLLSRSEQLISPFTRIFKIFFPHIPIHLPANRALRPPRIFPPPAVNSNRKGVLRPCTLKPISPPPPPRSSPPAMKPSTRSAPLFVPNTRPRAPACSPANRRRISQFRSRPPAVPKSARETRFSRRRLVPPWPLPLRLLPTFATRSAVPPSLRR